jgi:hypothetical protein
VDRSVKFTVELVNGVVLFAVKSATGRLVVATQLMEDAQPDETVEPSEWKTKVSEPVALFAVTVPGEVVPQYVPIKGDATLLPL